MTHIITPDVIQITPTRMDFQFDNVPRHWMFNDAFSTHFLGTLSTLFPVGERFFADSVRQLREHALDKAAQKNISGFIGQEAMHSLEHVSLNNMLEAKGLPALRAEKFTLGLLNLARRVLSKRQQLAITVALEHFTAIIANRLLSDTSVMEGLADEMRPVWMWHAIEETEHKAVAFDLYRSVPGNNYAERIVTQVFASVILAAVVSAFQVQFMYRDKTLLKAKTWGFGLNKLFGFNGIITGLIPEYLDYFKRDFHPWEHENSALVAHWRDKLNAIATPVPLNHRAKADAKEHAA
ncbi:MAG: metal-dependent hydrolase [Paraperlucidibaca sp.]